MKIEPILDYPACIIGNSLIITDLHLGIERSYKEEGIRIPTQTKKWKKKIIEITKEQEINELILLGDVKNKIPTLSWQERKEIPNFLEEIAEKYKITIIPGNHDGNIHKLKPRKTENEIEIKDTNGITRNNLYLFHGHTWPKKEAFSKSKIIMGHNHPIIRFKDELGRRHDEKSWIRVYLNKEKISNHYKDEITWNNPQLIIEPAFNSLVGGVAFNGSRKNFLGPLLNSGTYKYQSMETNLVDGTYLGKVKRLEKVNHNKKN